MIKWWNVQHHLSVEIEDTLLSTVPTVGNNGSKSMKCSQGTEVKTLSEDTISHSKSDSGFIAGSKTNTITKY